MLTQPHKPADRRSLRRRQIRRAIAKRHAPRSAQVCAATPVYAGPPIDLPVMEFLVQSGYDDQILYGSNSHMDSVPAWLQQEVAQRCWPVRPTRPVEVEPYVAPAPSLPWGAVTAAAMGGWAFLQLLSAFSLSTFLMCLVGLLMAEQKLPVPQGYRRLFQGGTLLTIIVVSLSVVLS